ncbi:MAG: hypothetical protein AAFV53_05655 [Myxococcota bacterium]
MMMLLWVGLAFAGPQEDYEAGIAALRAGDDATAVAKFSAALEGGGRDPAVYHGLGNALYRQQKLGAAIAAWERGHRLSPGNGDIAANLERARKETRDRLAPPAPAVGPFFWQRWLAPRQSAVLASLAVTVGLSLWAVGVGVGVGTGRRLRRLAAGLCAAGALLVASTGWALRQAQTAVVTADEIVVKSALGPAGVDLFSLHAGAAVELLEQTEPDAALIGLSDGRKGWAPRSVLIVTDPGAPFPTD